MPFNRRTSRCHSALNRHSTSIVKSKKGKRAERNRRTEYLPVLLESGIISRKELDAVDGLCGLNHIAHEDSQTTSLFAPSKPENLPKTVEKFAEFVGPSKAATSVEFIPPQVARALKMNESVLKFIIEVLLSLQVVTSTGNGTYLWQGTEKIWKALSENATLVSDSTSSDERCSMLQRICVFYFDLLCTHKEPISIAFVCQQISFRLKNQDDSSALDCRKLSQVIRCVSAVLIGIGIIKDVRTQSCIHYSLDASNQQQQTTSEDCSEKTLCLNRNKPPEFACNFPQSVSPLSTTCKTSTGSEKHNSNESRNHLQNCVPVDLERNVEFFKALQNASLVTCGGTNQAQDCNESSNLRPMHAAVMEIIGNEVNALQVVGVLNNESQNNAERRQNTPSSSEHFIAVAIPEWLIQNQQRQNPVSPALPPMMMMMLQSAQTMDQSFLHQSTSWSMQQDQMSRFRETLANQHPFYPLQKSAPMAIGPDQVFHYPSHFETVAGLLKESFATQSRGFMKLNDQLQQYSGLNPF